MAIMMNGKIVSDRETKLKQKPTKKNAIKSDIGQKVCFIYNLELYEGKITGEPDEEHYLVEATNKNIHKSNEVQSSIQPRNKCTFYND